MAEQARVTRKPSLVVNKAAASRRTPKFDSGEGVFYDALEAFEVGPIGIPELIFIFLIALLIFGPKKLPELGRNIGKALTEFRRASNDLRHAVEEEMREVERQAAEAKRAATDAVSAASLDEIGSIDPHVADRHAGDTHDDDTHRVDPHAGDTRGDQPRAGTETVPADSPVIGDAPTNSPAGSRRYEKPAHGDV